MASVPQMLDLKKYAESGIRIEDSNDMEYHIVPSNTIDPSDFQTNEDIISELKYSIENIKSELRDPSIIDEFKKYCLEVIKHQSPENALEILQTVFEDN